ncbi:MAG: gp58-like family protein [Facklamia hominis]
MQLNLKDLDFKDGKYVYTFKPDKDFDSIDLLSDCFGDLAISHLQVEKNPDATYFVPPEVYEGNLGGIFKDLGELKMELKDKDNSDLWGQIRITAQGMLKEYHDTEFKSALAQTAKQLTAQLEDGESLARRILTAQGFQSYMTDKDKQVSSEITQIKDLIGQRVTKKEVEGIIGNSGDSIWLQVKDKVKATADGSKMSGDEILAEINMTNGLTKIKNKLIHLDGDTKMNNAFADNLLAKQFNTDSLTAFSAKIANLVATYIDAYKITALDSNFVRTRWNGISSNMSADGNGLTVRHRDGTYTKIGWDGLKHYDGGTGYQTNYLTDVITVSDLNHDSSRGYKWINLPSVYRGKNFNARVVFNDACVWQDTSGSYNTGYMFLQRIVCYIQQDSIDYRNARVPLVGYARCWDTRQRRAVNFPVQAQVIVTY